MRKTIFRRRRVAAHPLARGRLTGLIEDPLSWDIQVRGDLAIVAVDGELDFNSAPGLIGQLGPEADAAATSSWTWPGCGSATAPD